jgi:hypothetical protein
MKEAPIIAKALKVLHPLEKWAHRCHEASITLVQAGIGVRVARGGCTGVGSQHSWVVDGDNCYARDAIIIDPTLWSYNKAVKGIWFGSAAQGWHRPHGTGQIWQWGKPECGNGPVIKLDPKTKLSDGARAFLDLLGPLDLQGWGVLLSSAPVGGWPAAEIVRAAYFTKELKAFIPIDRVGMLTDLNPHGLYM